jgi:hypothetical protein
VHALPNIAILLNVQIRPDRQTLYWSATWPKEVEFLAKQFLVDAYKVQSLAPDRACQRMTVFFVVGTSITHNCYATMSTFKYCSVVEWVTVL